MRKAGIDAQTRRDIMGHESTSMDDRYTMIDDEALEDARRRMDAFSASAWITGRRRPATRIKNLKDELRRLEDPGDKPR